MCLSRRASYCGHYGPKHASLPFPHLRRLARSRYRRPGAARRLVPSHPRPWRLLFIDLRDHYGMTQCVADPRQPGVQAGRDAALGMGGADRRQGAQAARRHREPGPADRRGRGVHIGEIEVLGPAGELPMPVFGEQDYPEEIRLKYRFLDLRREQLHNNTPSAARSSIRCAGA